MEGNSFVSTSGGDILITIPREISDNSFASAKCREEQEPSEVVVLNEWVQAVEPEVEEGHAIPASEQED